MGSLMISMDEFTNTGIRLNRRRSITEMVSSKKRFAIKYTGIIAENPQMSESDLAATTQSLNIR